MDHHCKFLNNCIGSKNYYNFFRLLMVASLYLLFGIGIAIWVLVEDYRHPAISDKSFTSIPVIVFIVYSLVLLIPVQMLLWFHLYITCCRSMTTLEYLVRQSKTFDSLDQGNHANLSPKK
jgi:palmitoyltransferase